MCPPPLPYRQRTARKKTLTQTRSTDPLGRRCVGWVPLDKADEVARMLEQLSREQKFVGVRHLINVEPDPDWIMRSAVIEGLSVLMYLQPYV